LPFDKLKCYGGLILLVTLVITSIYKTYCIRNFKESKFKYYWNRNLFKEITSYSGWNLFGALSSVFNNQGINIVLNLFFGPVVNAASGISYQISTSINGFVLNFMTATRPQIIKYYAQKEIEKMMTLVFQSSKYSFFLLYIITLPFLLETEYILKIWLNEIPYYVVTFVRIIIILSLIESMSYSLMVAAQATGKIKKYQIIIGGCLLLNLPIAYLFIKFGYPPESALVIMLVNSVICLFLRLVMLKQMMDLSIRSFIDSVLVPVIIISVVASIPPFCISYYSTLQGFMHFLSVCITALVASLLSIYIFGLRKSEKIELKTWIFQFFDKARK